ncbi:MAG: hypothetical protein H6721_20645 [Sandaracinus sp.]|nr:hypothetical protein [Sandaracinus sp.]MCB9634540.1 hypothetical protein [Sandaracinus sp.]
MKLLIAGEGVTELGELAHEPQYRDGRMGVVPVLVSRVLEGVDYEITDAVVWSRLAHQRPGKRGGPYRVGVRGRGERVNVLGLVLRASEENLDAVVFVRDRDRSAERQQVLEDALEEARREFPSVRTVGGVAVEAIEAWALAAGGKRDCERHARPKEHFEGSVVETLEDADLELAATCSPSFARWLERARSLRAGDAE